MLLGGTVAGAFASPQEWEKLLVESRFRAVTAPFNCQTSREEAREYCEIARRHGALIAEVGVWRNTMSPDREAREAAIGYAIGQLELADRIGARCCVNILGAVGPRWDGAYRENFNRETWDRGVKTIRQIIDAVNPQNTYFTIESMPWMVPTGPDECLRLMDAVERDRFAVHMDAFNWMTTPRRYFFNEEFVEECFEKLGKYTRSCHLKDVRLEEDYTIFLRETYPGNGGINIRHLIETALKYDPQMPFIIEHLDSDEAYLAAIHHVKAQMK